MYRGRSKHEPKIPEGTKLTKPQAKAYTRLFRDAATHYKPGDDDISLIDVDSVGRITLAKLIESGLIVETVAEHTETYGRFGEEIERTYTATTHHIAAKDELAQVIKDEAHVFALEIVAARIEHERLNELAEQRKQEVCKRFMIPADDIQVTANTEYAYEDDELGRNAKKFVNYRFELGEIVERKIRRDEEKMIKGFESFASVNRSYDGKTPDICCSGITASVEYAKTMARSILKTAQIVEAGLWK